VARLTVVEALHRTQEKTTVAVIELDQRTPPVSIAEALKLPRDAAAVYVLRVRHLGASPLLVTEAWLPSRLASRALTRERLQNRALYDILTRSCGVTFGRVLQEVSAELADPVRARLLEVGIGSPLLRIERLSHDHRGRPVQHLTISASPDRARIVTEYAAEEVDTVASGIITHCKRTLSRTLRRP
jgi:GntR family transcriptional regulator